MNELTPNAQLRIQYWLDIIHQCRESGQSNSQWCTENGISIKSYYYWLAKIRKMAVEELPRKKHAFCQTERILCRCNCKRHRRCADNHPGTSGRLYQSAFRNRKKSGSTVTHRQKRAASDTGKACAGCLWSWAETASAGILPKSKLGVDIEKDFEPEYINIRGKGDLIKSLKSEAKNAKKIYLATDPDREGEAISWHLLKALKLEDKKVYRITFNEITKTR